MTFKTHTSTIRTIRPGDRHFRIIDKFVITPRAGFEISKSCPDEYISILRQAVQAGWIKPVAHVTERELLFMGLTNE